jgi:hypothetical protein
MCAQYSSGLFHLEIQGGRNQKFRAAKKCEMATLMENLVSLPG